MVTIQVKNIEGKTTIPIAGTKLAAGYDIVAVDDPIIVGNVVEVDGKQLYDSVSYIEYHTALYISPQDSNRVVDGEREKYHTLLHPRSSIRKMNLVLANSVGLVDCFSENSKIKTEDGDKTINELRINDIVYSVNENLEVERDFVSAIINLGHDEILQIETDNETLEITSGTMVYTESGIKRADELVLGEKILHF